MKLSIAMSMALALIAISVFAIGLTSMATVDLGKNYCDSDNSCLESCCLFYNRNYGVCNKESNCNSIKLLSMEQSNHITTAKSQNLALEKKASFLNSVMISGLLFIISLFVLVIGNRRGI